jgi:hypothetical protein
MVFSTHLHLTLRFSINSSISGVRLQGRAVMLLPGTTTYEGHLDVTGKIRNMVLIKPGFHMQKNFSKNYPQFGHAASKSFCP